jgi:hypothetical protein
VSEVGNRKGNTSNLRAENKKESRSVILFLLAQQVAKPCNAISSHLQSPLAVIFRGVKGAGLMDAVSSVASLL